MIAAVPYSSAADSLAVVAHALIFGTPVLFIVFAGAIWLAVGSTLRPIDLLRRGAARVTGAGLPADLPVPEARDEVRLLALTLNDMLSRLAAAQQRQRSLVSDTAHELRSPIASIRTQLEVALDHPSGQDWASTARDVHADVLRLARLAEDLLLLARLDEQADLGDAGRRGELIDLGSLACARRRALRRCPRPGDRGAARAGRALGRSGSGGSGGESGPARPDAGQPDRQRGAVREVVGRGLGQPVRRVDRAHGHRRRPGH